MVRYQSVQYCLSNCPLFDALNIEWFDKQSSNFFKLPAQNFALDISFLTPFGQLLPLSSEGAICCGVNP